MLPYHHVHWFIKYQIDSLFLKLTDKVLPGIWGVQGVIDQSHDPVKHAGKERFASGRNGEVDLVHVLTLLHEVLADLSEGHSVGYLVGHSSIYYEGNWLGI